MNIDYTYSFLEKDLEETILSKQISKIIKSGPKYRNVLRHP